MSSSQSPPSSLGGGGEGPSSSRRGRRVGNNVWPEPFVEDLALLVAIDASHSLGRLAAAQALALIFQVRHLFFIIKLLVVYKSCTYDKVFLTLIFNSKIVRLNH